MDRDFSKQLTKQIGEHLVVAELGRRKIIAAPFAGNVPTADIVAYANGTSIPLQVKALRKGSASVNVQDFLIMRLEGKTQYIDGLREIDQDLIYVLVWVAEDRAGDRFFIYSQGELQRIIESNHRAVLAKHKGERPKNPESMHCAYGVTHLAHAENRWELIEKRLGLR